MSTYSRSPLQTRRRQRGFTLVELMVALVIGLLTTVVITQVLWFSEGQKRTTTSGADAQLNGAMALYMLQRDIQMAGYGFSSSPDLIGCPIYAKYAAADIATGAAAADQKFPTQLVPVSIDTTDPVRNKVRIVSSSKQSYSVPTRVLPPDYDPANAAKRYVFPVSSSLGVAAGDLLLAVKDATVRCEVFQVTAKPGSAGQIDRADDGAKWNAVGFPTAVYGDGDSLVNLGRLVDNTYSISAAGTLQKRQFDLTTDGSFAPSYTQTDAFANIVNLQAYYGKDTDGDGSIDKFDQVAPTNNVEWQQVIAIRLALVARSATYEKDPNTTTTNPLWQVGDTPAMTPAPVACGANKCVELDIKTLPDWGHYRYKIFDTVVPLRNLVWKS